MTHKKLLAERSRLLDKAKKNPKTRKYYRMDEKRLRKENMALKKRLRA